VAASARSQTRWIALILFVALAAGTVAAFAVAQRLKGEPLILDKVVFRPAVLTPNGDCRRDRARARFRLTRSDRAKVEIVDLEDRTVRGIDEVLEVFDGGRRLPRRLSDGRPLESYRFYVVRWDGRTDRGFLAAPGPYKLRVTLLGQDRELVPPGRFRLHEVPRRPRGGCAEEAPAG
jgi:hypothetical protein